MTNTLDPEKLKKAPVASSCFMGLGQILYLKQYIRGALFALIEVVMLCCIIFGTKKIIPANNKENAYINSIPAVDEMVDFLSEAEYKKLDGILAKRAAAVEKFFKKVAVKDFAEFRYQEEILDAEPLRHEDKAAYKDAVAEAKENKFDLVSELKETFDGFDYKDFDDVESALDEIIDDDVLVEKYEKTIGKYDETLAKAIARISPEDFDENYDGCSLCKRAHRKGHRTVAHRAWFQGPIVSSLAGLITLGSKQNTTVTKYMDHSIFMMIDGIFALIIIGFFVFLYILNINSAKASVKKFIKIGHFQSWKEAKNDISQNSFATIGIAPSLVMIAIFSIIPLLFSALVAFTNYSSPDHIPPNNLVDWVGLENFVTMFSMKVGGGEWAKTFGWTAIWTIVWAIFATFTCFFVGFFYAFVLQDRRVVIPKFFRTVYILPYAIPTMLSLFVWANLLNGTVGPINRTLQIIGLIDQPIPWLSDPWVAKGALIFVNIWIGFPYSMILTTSSMTAISNSLYEAAVIDGATKWQQFKSITYPLVMFQLKPTLIMQFAGNINNFGAVFFLTGGGPNMPQAGLTTVTNCGATDLLISWIYKLTMNTPSRYNLASVLSLLVFVVLVPFALYNYTRTKSFKEGEV